MKSPLPPPADAGEILSFAAAFNVERRDGLILLAPESPLNHTGAWHPLVSLYEEATPLPPTPEEVDTLLTELLGLGPQRTDSGEFEIQAAILRAAAKQYYAA